MDRTLVDDYAIRVEKLKREGQALRTLLAGDQSSPSTLGTLRSWQQACASTITALSGGSKAHWLSRAFSEAFLVRSTAGDVVAQAPLIDIVERILSVLEQAGRSVAQISDAPAGLPADSHPHRFDFVYNQALRPVLEQAYNNSQAALDAGDFASSLMTSCGILEAIITDALEHVGETCHDWTFEQRIDAARQARLIRNGCARLPSVARTYRDLTDHDGELRDAAEVSARDARVTAQVLQVVMRDLNPSR